MYAFLLFTILFIFFFIIHLSWRLVYNLGMCERLMSPDSKLIRAAFQFKYNSYRDILFSKQNENSWQLWDLSLWESSGDLFIFLNECNILHIFFRCQLLGRLNSKETQGISFYLFQFDLSYFYKRKLEKRGRKVNI